MEKKKASLKEITANVKHAGMRCNHVIWGLLLQWPSLSQMQLFFTELMMEFALEVCYKYGQAWVQLCNQPDQWLNPVWTGSSLKKNPVVAKEEAGSGSYGFRLLPKTTPAPDVSWPESGKSSVNSWKISVSCSNISKSNNHPRPHNQRVPLCLSRGLLFSAWPNQDAWTPKASLGSVSPLTPDSVQGETQNKTVFQNH